MDPDHESLDFVSVRLKKLVDMVRSVNLPTFQSVSYLIIQKKALANVGYIKYPLVIFQVATENGPVEIVVFPMKIAWWIFPVRFMYTLTSLGIQLEAEVSFWNPTGPRLGSLLALGFGEAIAGVWEICTSSGHLDAIYGHCFMG